MSAEKITVTVNPEALEVVLRASKLAADKQLVELSHIAEYDLADHDPRFKTAVQLVVAIDELLSDLEEARLAQ